MIQCLTPPGKGEEIFLFYNIQQPGCEVNYSAAPSAGAMNEWSYAYIPPKAQTAATLPSPAMPSG
jgi:hypothetical protein